MTFDNVAGGLVSSDGQPIREFFLAGTDKKLVAARAEIVSEDTIVLQMPGLDKPLIVRYAFQTSPHVNLFNGAAPARGRLPNGRLAHTHDERFGRPRPATAERLTVFQRRRLYPLPAGAAGRRRGCAADFPAQIWISELLRRSSRTPGQFRQGQLEFRAHFVLFGARLTPLKFESPGGSVALGLQFAAGVHEVVFDHPARPVDLPLELLYLLV